VLQHLGRINTIVFDKTGTITEGTLHVKDFYTEKPGKDIISTIASIESYSNHSIAKAIVEHCKEKGLPLYKIKNVKSSPGMGISGNVIKKGKSESVKLGNARYLKKSRVKIPDKIIKMGDKAEEAGSTVVYFSIDKKKFGFIALMDTLKENAGSVVESLKSMGINVMLLSGDSEKTTSKVAEMAGISDFRAEFLPEEKLDLIEELQNSGSNTAMVGDGVNDAPALARADTGIAMGSGTEIAIESSDVVMMRNDLSLIPQVIKVSNFTIKVIKLNLLWAFIYNVVGVLLAVTGIVTPLLAAFAMVLSSLSVTGNSLRIRRMKLHD
jgi:Cu+-exporting ATPase